MGKNPPASVGDVGSTCSGMILASHGATKPVPSTATEPVLQGSGAAAAEPSRCSCRSLGPRACICNERSPGRRGPLLQ